MDELNENGESAKVRDIAKSLDDERPGTLPISSVKQYFDVLEEEGIVEYEDSVTLGDAYNRQVKLNGYDGDIDEFIELNSL